MELLDTNFPWFFPPPLLMDQATRGLPNAWSRSCAQSQVPKKMSSTTRSFVAAVRFVSTILMVAIVLEPDDHVAIYFVHVPPGDAAVSNPRSGANNMAHPSGAVFAAFRQRRNDS